MKSKWYISTLIISLTLLGIVSQQQISAPNQEIVLQFSEHEVTYDDAQNAIALVKKQLQTIGIVNVQVHEQEDGSLKIMYYSAADVASIKKIFSNETQLGFDHIACEQDDKSTKFPFKSSNKKIASYNLDVFEIQKGSDLTLDLGGKFALELKADNDRFFNPNIYLSFEAIDVKGNSSGFKETYKLRRNIAIAIDNTSHIIPEVRAGPKV